MFAKAALRAAACAAAPARRFSSIESVVVSPHFKVPRVVPVVTVPKLPGSATKNTEVRRQARHRGRWACPTPSRRRPAPNFSALATAVRLHAQSRRLHQGGGRQDRDHPPAPHHGALWDRRGGGMAHLRRLTSSTLRSLPIPCRGVRPSPSVVQLSDKVALAGITALRSSFDWITGYGDDMTVAKYTQRIVFLETVAGVPGMVAAMARHLRSLRTMKRDFG